MRRVALVEDFKDGLESRPVEAEPNSFFISPRRKPTQRGTGSRRLLFLFALMGAVSILRGADITAVSDPTPGQRPAQTSEFDIWNKFHNATPKKAAEEPRAHELLGTVTNLSKNILTMTLDQDDPLGRSKNGDTITVEISAKTRLRTGDRYLPGAQVLVAAAPKGAAWQALDVRERQGSTVAGKPEPEQQLTGSTAPTLVETNLGSPPKDSLKDGVSISADSRHVGYLFTKVGGTTVLSGFRFNPAGVQVVIDGKQEKTKYRLLSMPVFSEDGRHYAYTGGAFASAPGKGDKMVFVADGREYDDGVSGFLGESPRFSPDGQRFAYCATVGSTNFVVADGKKERAYTNVGDIVFSPDSKHLAHAASRDGKWCMVNEDRKSVV